MARAHPAARWRGTCAGFTQAQLKPPTEAPPGQHTAWPPLAGHHRPTVRPAPARFPASYRGPACAVLCLVLAQCAPKVAVIGAVAPPLTVLCDGRPRGAHCSPRHCHTGVRPGRSGGGALVCAFPRALGRLGAVSLSHAVVPRGPQALLPAISEHGVSLCRPAGQAM